MVRYTPSVFGFPNKLITKLRYSDYHNLSVTSGALAKYVYRWNSTWDPNYTGTGHQPLYRDTYANVYYHYSVIRATARITFSNTDSDNPYIVGVVTEDDATSATGFTTLMEQSNGQYQQLTALPGSQSLLTFNTTWDCKRNLGIDPMSSAQYKTAVGDDPTDDSYLVLWAQIEDGTSTAAIPLGVTIELIQEVLWSELQTPSPN